MSQKIEQEINRIRAKHLARVSLYRVDAEDDVWITIKGTPVNIGDEDHIWLPKGLKEWVEKNRGQSHTPGSAGKPTTPIRNCKTPMELSKLLKDRYGIKVGTQAKAWFHLLGGHEIVIAAMGDFDNVLNELPELKGYFANIGLTDALMSTGPDGSLSFNQDVHTADEFDEICDRQAKSGRCPPNATPESMFVHECAHALVNLIIEKETGFNRGTKDFEIARTSGTIVIDIVSEADKLLKQSDPGNVDFIMDEIKNISGYAYSRKTTAKKCSEVIAEAFADCYSNGKNATAFSRALKEVTLRRLRQK